MVNTIKLKIISQIMNYCIQKSSVCQHLPCNLQGQLYQKVITYITSYVLHLMTDQQKLINENNTILKLCINMFIIYISLFCSHKIQQCKTEDECLKLNNFNPYWQFKASIYSQVISFLHINDLVINPLLQMANPSVA